MNWQNQLKGDSLAWLLEQDPPNVRYMALHDLMEYPADNKELLIARAAAYTEGPIASILAEMDDEGYWVKPGPGYSLVDYRIKSIRCQCGDGRTHRSCLCISYGSFVYKGRSFYNDRCSIRHN